MIKPRSDKKELIPNSIISIIKDPYIVLTSGKYSIFFTIEQKKKKPRKNKTWLNELRQTSTIVKKLR